MMWCTDGYDGLLIKPCGHPPAGESASLLTTARLSATNCYLWALQPASEISKLAYEPAEDVHVQYLIHI